MMLSNMQKHQYILESELCGINIENREDAIRYIQKCIEDCNWSILKMIYSKSPFFKTGKAKRRNSK